MNLAQMREKNLAETINAVRGAVNEDALINHASNSIDELDKAANLLVKRFREWIALTLPEVEHGLHDHEKLLELTLSRSRSELLKEFRLTEGQSMGAVLSEADEEEALLLARQIRQLYELREKHRSYLDRLLQRYAPNLRELCGATIAANLIERAGSLRRLALLPSSTVQLLGAEKALFRHLTRKAKPPKHGLIINHPIVANAKKAEKGKAARALAERISMCARLDYFKGEFKAPEYKKELEGRFG